MARHFIGFAVPFRGFCRIAALAASLSHGSEAVAAPVATDCSQFVSEPELTFRFSKPDPMYISVPSDLIRGQDGVKNPLKTMGLTKAEFFISYDFKIRDNAVADGHCLNITKLHFSMGYKSLDVLIDNKYRQGSCEYSAIRDHESVHVKIHMDKLNEYIPKIRDEIRIIGMNLPPLHVPSVSRREVDRAVREAIMGNERIDTIVQKLKSDLDLFNGVIDTPEEYKHVSGMCRNW
jgi:hypothetical protein